MATTSSILGAGYFSAIKNSVREAEVAGLSLVVHVGQDGADGLDHDVGAGGDPAHAGTLTCDLIKWVGEPGVSLHLRERGDGLGFGLAAS